MGGDEPSHRDGLPHCGPIPRALAQCFMLERHIHRYIFFSVLCGQISHPKNSTLLFHAPHSPLTSFGRRDPSANAKTHPSPFSPAGCAIWARMGRGWPLLCLLLPWACPPSCVPPKGAIASNLCVPSILSLHFLPLMWYWSLLLNETGEDPIGSSILFSSHPNNNSLGHKHWPPI